jgi:hypothetical protein
LGNGVVAKYGVDQSFEARQEEEKYPSIKFNNEHVA